MMRNEKIIKKLKKEGYDIEYKTWEFWNVPHIRLKNGEWFAIAELLANDNQYSINLDFIYNHVLDAVNVANTLNDDFKGWEYNSPEPILSMGNYYRYKKNLFPYDSLNF